MSPAAIRYGGLAGALLLAVAAVLIGAGTPWTPGVTPASVWRGEHGPLGLAAWLVGTGLLVGAWWLARDRVPSQRWAAVTAGLWLAPLLVVPPLGSRDVYAYACQGAVYAAGEDPYGRGVAALPCPWLAWVSPTWWDTPAPYGPLFVLLAGAAVTAGGTLAGTVALLRLLAVAGVVLAALSLPGLARRHGVPPARALWLALACPLVGVHLVAGAHNDAIMIGLLLAGLCLLSTRTGGRWLLAGGALLGLAAAVKVTAAVAVPFAALVTAPGPARARTGYPGRMLARDGGLVGGGAVLAMVAVTIGGGLDLGWLRGLTSSGESVQWTSPPTAVGLTIGYLARPLGLTIDAVPAARVVGLVLLAVVLVVLWWQARRHEPLAVAGVALAATVALAPVFHPWYALLPAAVLAATSRRTGWWLWPTAAACFLVLPDGYNLARSVTAAGAIAMTGLTGWALWWLLRAPRPGLESLIGPPTAGPAMRRWQA